MDIFFCKKTRFLLVNFVEAATFFCPFKEVEALVNITLNGAYRNAKLFGKQRNINAFTLVEPGENNAKALSKLLASFHKNSLFLNGWHLNYHKFLMEARQVLSNLEYFYIF